MSVMDSFQNELKGARGPNKEKAKKKVDRLKDQYKKLKISRTDKARIIVVIVEWEWSS